MFRTIERDFGGEVRKFSIAPIGCWRAIEDARDCGIGEIGGRLYSCMAKGLDGRTDPQAFKFYGDDIRDVLLQGLKGGGMTDADASKLIRTTFDQADGILQFASLAVEIVAAFLLGVPKKAETPKQTEAAAAPPASTSVPSTAQAQ